VTSDEKRALKAAIDANPHLYSARHNRDYLTMAIEVNQVLKPEDHVTELEVHEVMLLVDQALAP
jgi:hypothetical protein